MSQTLIGAVQWQVPAGGYHHFKKAYYGRSDPTIEGFVPPAANALRGISEGGSPGIRQQLVVHQKVDLKQKIV